jgi:hypothetical protein
VAPAETESEHRRNLIVADAFVRREGSALLIADEADELLAGPNPFASMFCLSLGVGRRGGG